jgi:hypothetical protein
MTMDAYRIKRALKETRRTKTFYKYLYPGKSPILISGACKFLLDNCDSSFLFDEIIKAQDLKILQGVKFQVFELRKLKKDLSWILSCQQISDKKLLISKAISFSNFPIEEITIWLIDKVALLPSEY